MSLANLNIPMTLFSFQRASVTVGLLPIRFASHAHRKSDAAGKQIIEDWWSGDASVQLDDVFHLVEHHAVSQRIEQLCESYKQQAIDALSHIDNMSVKGLLRRVVGKIFNDVEIKGWCSEFTSTDAALHAASKDAPR